MGMSKDVEALKCKAGRLAVAGVIATEVRAGNSRRVALTDKDGNVTGYRTLGEVQQQILARAKIELDVEKPCQKEKAVCRACGHLFEVALTNPYGFYCQGGCRKTCEDCGKALRLHPCRLNSFGAKPARCKPCHARHNIRRHVTGGRSRQQCPARRAATADWPQLVQQIQVHQTAGANQTAIARALGLSKSTVSYILRALEMSRPERDTIRKRWTQGVTQVIIAKECNIAQALVSYVLKIEAPSA